MNSAFCRRGNPPPAKKGHMLQEEGRERRGKKSCTTNPQLTRACNGCLKILSVNKSLWEVESPPGISGEGNVQNGSSRVSRRRWKLPIQSNFREGQGKRRDWGKKVKGIGFFYGGLQYQERERKYRDSRERTDSKAEQKKFVRGRLEF